jgi:DNA-binding response OmpR family regulator
MTDLPGRIMLIDDDDNLREVMTETLQIRGNVSVMPCRDCYQAVSASEEFRPNLILLDLRMPGKDGPETLKVLRQVNVLRDVPVIFVTGADKVHMQDDYRKLGVIGVIHKPFMPSELREYISSLWAEYHMAQ